VTSPQLPPALPPNVKKKPSQKKTNPAKNTQQSEMKRKSLHLDFLVCRDVDELIQSNADYLVNSISLRLRHFDRHPRSPSVLSVMLQLCSTNILMLVWDSIVEVCFILFLYFYFYYMYFFTGIL
jgi:hypothetical protein